MIFRHSNPRSFVLRAIEVMLLVTVFALSYYMLISVAPDQIHFYENHEPIRRMRLLDAVYFSLVTQSTVGYGVITPASDIAKCVVSMQVMSTLAICIYFTTRIV